MPEATTKTPKVASSRRAQAASAPGPAQRLSRAEQYAAGKALRQACPRASHAAWKTPPGRLDPVQMVLAAEKGRLPELLPLRHGRMVRSAFTFYRGSALAMAADLAPRPPPERPGRTLRGH